MADWPIRARALIWMLGPGQTINVWRSNTIKHCLVTKHFTVWTPCLVLFDHVCLCLVVFEKIWRPSNIQATNWNRDFFCSRVWWAIFCSFGQLRIKHVWSGACVPHLLSGLYQLFDPCLIKHVLTVWPLTSTLACLITKQCLMVFGVCPGP